MNTDWKRGFAETAYKRLYWQGFQGNFYSFEWPTFSNLEGPLDELLGIDEAANLTYTPSEFQAYRSGQALKNFLQGLNQTPTHLLAHSMGNVVAAEALRLWNDFSENALVTNYVSMQSAFSSGGYGLDSTDAMQFSGQLTALEYWFGAHGAKRVNWNKQPLQNGSFRSPNDLLRHWPAGFDAVNEQFYMQGAESAAGNWINMYNPQDSATNVAWRTNNITKHFVNDAVPNEPPTPIGSKAPGVDEKKFLPPPEIWEWRYDVQYTSNGLPVATYRIPYTERGEYDVPTEQWERIDDTALQPFSSDLTPGPTAYELIAFTSISNAPAVGNVGNLDGFGWFDSNSNIIASLGIDFDKLGSAAFYPNHSFQFHYDAATTAPFWEYVREETSFTATVS